MYDSIPDWTATHETERAQTTVALDSGEKQPMMVVPSTSSHDGRGLTPSGPGASASG